MLGRGLLYQEAANALDIDEMDIHEWNTTVPDFRRWVTILPQDNAGRTVGICCTGVAGIG